MGLETLLKGGFIEVLCHEHYNPIHIAQLLGFERTMVETNTGGK